MKLLVYSDFAYRRDGEDVWAEEAFVLFCARLAEAVDGLTLVGRLDPEPGRWHYRLPASIEFAALPHYGELSRRLDMLRGAGGALRAFWRALRDVDAVWLLGPHPLSIAFALLAALRGKRVALGVRQDFPRYVANRHPGRRSMRVAAGVLEGAYRVQSRLFRTVVVGPDLAARYRGARRLLEISVSLIGERDLVTLEEATSRRSGEGRLTALSVGRLDAEKNPLLLADVLARLDPRWRLVVCGDGPLREELAERLRAEGLDARADLRGYVPLGGDLLRLYRESDAFLHVSWTEGVPQVLFEAFAAGLPVVATDVGGVREAVGDAAVLIPPGDAEVAAAALERLAADPELRAGLVEAGLAQVREHTSEAESRRLAEFLG